MGGECSKSKLREDNSHNNKLDNSKPRVDHDELYRFLMARYARTLKMAPKVSKDLYLMKTHVPETFWTKDRNAYIFRPNGTLYVDIEIKESVNTVCIMRTEAGDVGMDTVFPKSGAREPFKLGICVTCKRLMAPNCCKPESTSAKMYKLLHTCTVGIVPEFVLPAVGNPRVDFLVKLQTGECVCVELDDPSHSRGCDKAKARDEYKYMVCRKLGMRLVRFPTNLVSDPKNGLATALNSTEPYIDLSGLTEEPFVMHPAYYYAINHQRIQYATARAQPAEWKLYASHVRDLLGSQ